jgi:hypothetical protein
MVLCPRNTLTLLKKPLGKSSCNWLDAGRMSTLRCRMRLTPLNASIATATNAIKKQRQQSETGPTPTRTNENQELLDVPLTTRRDGSPPSFPGGPPFSRTFLCACVYSLVHLSAGRDDRVPRKLGKWANFPSSSSSCRTLLKRRENITWLKCLW